MSNKLSLIYDIETMDTAATAVVLSIGILAFDAGTQVPFAEQVAQCGRFKFNVDEQIAMGRTWSQSTIEWWGKPEQVEAYQRVCVPSADDISITQIDAAIGGYLASVGYDANNSDHVWTRGYMDGLIVGNVYNQLGLVKPWSFWNERDSRTAIDTIAQHLDPNHKGNGKVNMPDPVGFIPHMETHDVVKDVHQMQACHILLMNQLSGAS